MTNILQDIRYGVRMLVKHPWISMVAIVTLALGMGVNGVIFSGTYAVLLKSLPYANSDRLVVVGSTDRTNQLEIQSSYADFIDWKARSRTIERMAAVGGGTFALTTDGRTGRFDAAMVSPDFFPLLGVSPLIGRTLSAEDYRRSDAPSIVISYALWHRVFGMNPGVVGRIVLLDNKSATIVGVMPQTFQYPQRAALWTTLEAGDHRALRNVGTVGAMRPGATLSEVRAELSGIAIALESEYPATNKGIATTVITLDEELVGRRRGSLLVLQCAVALVLLIACANLANLLLAQTASRQREFGIRVAIGATRKRLVRQLLSESFVLSLAGGAVGFVFARWTLAYLQSELTDSLGPLGRFNGIALNLPVISMMALATVLTAVLVGLTPALTSSKPDLERLLRDGGHGGIGRKHRRMQSVLVVSEIALAMMLLIASGLMIRTFRNLTNADPGLRTENILTMRVPLSESKYSDQARSMAFYKELEQRVRALPGVESFAAVGYLPFIGYNGGINFRIDGQSPQDRPFRADIQPMTPDYFKIVGMTMRRGRPFLQEDWKVQAEVAIVNGAFIRRFLGNEEPLGVILELESVAGPGQAVPIIGVVNDVNQFGMYSEPRPEIYIPVTRRMMYLTVQTSGNPNVLASAVRQQVEQIEAEQAVINVRSFESVMSSSYAARRVLGILLSGLGAIALAMVTIAIYGIIAYSVAQRSHEIGVRMALGASRRRVLSLIIHSGMRLTLMGILCGMLGAIGLSRLLARFLYGVTSTDPITYLTIGAIVSGIGFMACYLPARRATRVDPIVTLRCE